MIIMKHSFSLTNGSIVKTNRVVSLMNCVLNLSPMPANLGFTDFSDSSGDLQPDTRTRILDLFGVKIRNTTKQAVIEVITDRIRRQQKSRVAFVNADCVNKYYKDDDYKNILNEFQLVLADGVGVRLAAKFQGVRLKDNVNGTDLFPGLLKRLAEQGKSVFFFGAAPGVAATMCERLSEQFPGLRIAGHQNGYDFGLEDSRIIEQINQSAADVVFVALGAPKQEKWINRHHENLNAGILIGVGGLFDFYSGNVRRAPLWVRKASSEWVWRLIMQPRDKAKRYLMGNPLFIYRVVRHHLIITAALRFKPAVDKVIVATVEVARQTMITLGIQSKRLQT